MWNGLSERGRRRTRHSSGKGNEEIRQVAFQVGKTTDDDGDGTKGDAKT